MVILFVRADKPDIHEVDGKLDDDDDAMVVAHDIEHIALISHRIHRIERQPDVGEVPPPAVPYHILPFLQRRFRFRMLPDILAQSLFREYSHVQS
jgi:hypothetical protein